MYHSDTEKKCEEFIAKKGSLILSNNSKDDIWLGRGMYFWDNRGNANWWRRKQHDRHPKTKYRIVTANVNLSNLLDLTDFEVYRALDNLWKQVCKVAQLDENVPLGNKLNFLFDSLNFAAKYDLIKVYGKYNRTPNNGFFIYDYSTLKSEPTIGVKCIYNVKVETCIMEKELVEEVEQ